MSGRITDTFRRLKTAGRTGLVTYVTGGDVSRFQRRTAPAQGTSAPQAAYGDGQPVRSGPSVRVTRGKQTEDVSIGAVGSSTARGAASAAQTLPAAQAVGVR